MSNTLNIPIIRTKANHTTYSTRFEHLYTLKEAECIIAQRKRFARIRLKRKIKRAISNILNASKHRIPILWGLGLMVLSIIMQRTTGEVNQYLFTIPIATGTLFIKS